MIATRHVIPSLQIRFHFGFALNLVLIKVQGFSVYIIFMSSFVRIFVKNSKLKYIVIVNEYNRSRSLVADNAASGFGFNYIYTPSHLLYVSTINGCVWIVCVCGSKQVRRQATNAELHVVFRNIFLPIDTLWSQQKGNCHLPNSFSIFFNLLLLVTSRGVHRIRTPLRLYIHPPMITTAQHPNLYQFNSIQATYLLATLLLRPTGRTDKVLRQSSMGLNQVESRLPLGFRFFPNDEELVCHYLCKKINKERVCEGTLVEVDLHTCEPWELPGQYLRSNISLHVHFIYLSCPADLAKLSATEWYFFSFRDRKYSTGSRTNRATKTGYWKATGKDRSVYDPMTHALVGMRKTLVFYHGRAPNGIKTSWVMHEFRMETLHMPPKVSLVSVTIHKWNFTPSIHQFN